MSRGDHIYIQCIPHTHHAIDLGDGNVIEYSMKEGIRLRSKQDFSENKFVYTKRYTECFFSEETIRRAYSRLGERKYHLLENNCEHFACWCKTGIHASKQVGQVGTISGTVAAGVVGGTAIVTSVVAAPVVLGLGAAMGVHWLSKKK